MTLWGLVAAVCVGAMCVSSWCSNIEREHKAKEDAKVAEVERSALRERETAAARVAVANAEWDQLDKDPRQQSEERVRALFGKTKDVLGREEVARRARALLHAIDARRTLVERTSMISDLLAPNADADQVCRALRLAKPMTDADRKSPIAVSVLARLRAAAAAKLAEEHQRISDRRHLRCGDGTTSPTCSCGRPKRGCCSHHGGVAGCEPMPPLPKELSCGAVDFNAEPANW